MTCSKMGSHLRSRKNLVLTFQRSEATSAPFVRAPLMKIRRFDQLRDPLTKQKVF